MKRKSVTCSPRSQGLSPRAMVSTLWTRLRWDDNRLACRRTQTRTQKSVSSSHNICNLFSKWINYKWLVLQKFVQINQRAWWTCCISCLWACGHIFSDSSECCSWIRLWLVSMLLQFPWATKTKLIQEKLGGDHWFGSPVSKRSCSGASLTGDNMSWLTLIDLMVRGSFRQHGSISHHREKRNISQQYSITLYCWNSHILHIHCI